VADRSLTVLANNGVFPLAPGGVKRILNLSIQKTDSDPSPDALAAKLKSSFPTIDSVTLRPDTDPAVYARIREAAKSADLIVLSLFLQRDRMGDAAPIREIDLRLISDLTAARPGKVVAMSYGNPHLIRKIEGVAAFIVGYGERGWFGNQSIYFDSFVRLLKGEIKPEGKLPVRVSEKYPIGSGVRW